MSITNTFKHAYGYNSDYNNSAILLDMSYMYYHNNSIYKFTADDLTTSKSTKIIISNKYRLSTESEYNVVNSIEAMFMNCSNIHSIDLSNLNPTYLRNINVLCTNCDRLEYIILPCKSNSFGVNQIVSSMKTFRGCSNLTKISGNLCFPHLISAVGMFQECSKLENIDISIPSDNFMEMGVMFRDCKKLKKIDLSNINTSNVVSMHKAFMGCYKLQSVKLNNQELNKIEDLQFMFGDCRELKELDVIGLKLNAINDILVGDMFTGCTKLNKIFYSDDEIGDMLKYAISQSSDVNNTIQYIKIDG